jgi:hypothetical protein
MLGFLFLESIGTCNYTCSYLLLNSPLVHWNNREGTFYNVQLQILDHTCLHVQLPIICNTVLMCGWKNLEACCLVNVSICLQGW